MIPAAIFLFLVGTVLAWGFRVWILVPFSLLSMLVTIATELCLNSSIASALGSGILVGFAPQFGYAFGLLAQSMLHARHPGSARKASVALLYKKASFDERR